jgi:hypothetical protein
MILSTRDTLLVNITLTNHHKNTAYPYQHICFNVETRLFKLEDDHHVTRQELLNKNIFSHPIFDEPYTPTTDLKFQYDYNNLIEAMYITTFICTVLINTNKPDACEFKIQPSASFQKNKRPENIYFSINKHQQSKQAITVEQLNHLISTLYGTDFQYSNDLIVKQTITLKNLPDEINGDTLYLPPNPQLLTLFHQTQTCDAYELRYIDSVMGFGVFSRKNIKKGDFIGVYCGTQTHKKGDNLHYSFSITRNVNQKPSKFYTHALLSGNITRFVNHAPSQKKKSHRFLSANLKSTRHQLQGLTCIAFQAQQDIAAGEQLLIDYGGIYFQNKKSIRFKKNNKPIYGLHIKPFLHSKQNLLILKAMANQNIHAAKQYFFKRLFTITMLISIATAAFNFI